MSKSSPLPVWNLQDLFQNPKDPAIENCIKEQEARAKKLAHAYRGRLAALDAAELLSVIQTYESICQTANKPQVYTQLLFSTETTNEGYGALVQRLRARTQDISHHLLFIELELGRFSTAQVKTLCADKKLAPYEHFLKRQLAFQPHRLSEEKEKLLDRLSLTGRSAFIRLYDTELGRRKFPWPSGSKQLAVSQSEILDKLHSPDRDERKQAAAIFTQGLAQDLPRATYITNILIQNKAIEDQERSFQTPESSRHLENEIQSAEVEALLKAVQKYQHLVADYYQLKRRFLGASKLYDFDRYAPLRPTTVRYSFEQARELIIQAYNAFSPIFGEKAKDFFRNNWIHAAQTPGKRGGAYCMFVSPDHHPYVFVNYQGRLGDVLTLAHELGHGVHASLARAQTYVNYDTPLTIAETASVFGEMLVFDHLRKNLTQKEELQTLYSHKIESIFATVFRQMSMFSFERELHARVRAEGEQPAAAINQLWRKHQQKMFDSSVTLTANYDLWWSYISHFIHTPFYVYAYAFGELLTLALFAQYQIQGSAMTERYLQFITSGGSQSPEKLLSPLGVNLRQPNFWEGGLKYIKQLTDELRRIS